ncbi:centrosomal protein CEP57L1 [Amblyraja radiata]|uniref:centrosomal protein CEP57L1 n=1 Tax=Amblyraja radiata TaxID=386614 RepID=UPI00140329DA|nr:centrosomal protein CEP57L1 [Amblyraja radiata]
MESSSKRSSLGNLYALSSLENIPLSPVNVKPRPGSRHVPVRGSRNRDEAETLSTAANSKAIVSALKNLQEKIRSLEVERAEAEQKLQRLGFEAVQCRNTMEQERKDVNKETGKSNELAVQLTTVEGRCLLLEKQLDYMRTMVEHAETEKNNLLEKQDSLQMDRNWDLAELQAKLEKLDILEQECLKVNATQTRAESKINDLEQKLQEEEHQRKLIQDKAAQLQTGLEINRILLRSTSAKKKTKVKKRKGVVKVGYMANIFCARVSSDVQKEMCSSPRQWPGQAEFPFVAGRSISSSHSVTANVQNVLHLMKHYDGRPRLPDQRAAKYSRELTCSNGRVNSAGVKFGSLSPPPSPLTEGLSEILVALQDELGQMSFEHQDLLEQIQGTKDIDVREDLERELDCLVKRMEKKGDQISKLKNHQDHVERLNLKTKKVRRRIADTKKQPKAEDGMKGAPPKAAEPSRKTSAGQGKKGQESLQLLRNAQKLQTTLRRSDIVWDQ